MWGRIRQTIQALTSMLRPVDNNQAKQHLTDASFDLFMRMNRNDRQHHLRVLNDLLANNQNHPALLKAALLHDVGKIKYRFSILDRIIAVMAKTLTPAKFEEWSEGNPNSWRKAIVVSAKHPEWSEAYFRETDDDELAAQLIRYHQTPLEDMPPNPELIALLEILKGADDRN